MRALSTPDEFQTGMWLATNLAKQALLVPVTELREAVELADSLGPILDPTAWIRGRDNLPPQRELLDAVERLAQVARKYGGE